jgi:S-adenosylmethionine:tRNA ribosyltransferase-isomerase
MKLSDFDYNLPKNLIAQKPASPRDSSRLLVLSGCGTANRVGTGQCPVPTDVNEKNECEIKHKHFYDLPDYLNKGDVLVLNNSKVFPARLIGKKKETGGKIEVFLLCRDEALPRLYGRGHSVWQCLLGGHGQKENLEIEFLTPPAPLSKGGSTRLKCKVIENNLDGTWEVKFNMGYDKMMKVVEKIGQVPLPPYIKRRNRALLCSYDDDRTCYQTIYADKNKIGSVAAPTAGLHFTPSLIKKLKKKGVQFEYVTLHVGLGTFSPVKIENIKKHKMHAEMVEIKKETAQRILQAKKEGRRIIAVGTTSVRTLEGCLAKDVKKSISQITNYQLPITTFIYPGYKFKIVDAMITNFHLPKSTLLMLVSALAGKKNIDKAYQEAIKKKYRFYSYGDAMFLTGEQRLKKI